jgi:hypothetical protein
MQKSRRLAATIVACVLCPVFGLMAWAQSSDQLESVIIQTAKPYAQVVSRIEALGGKVKYQYKHVDGIAADVPISAMDALRSTVGAAAIVKDLVVPATRNPQSGIPNVQGHSVSAISNPAAFAALAPEEAYLLNNHGLNIRGLHAQGWTGEGVIVAVIDSGIRPDYPVLGGEAVIGGEDLVGDGLGFSNKKNDPHGTFVAGLITANTSINIHNTALETSLLEHFPPGILMGSDLPLIGTAPLSLIYVVRVLGATAAAGAPESRIIQAIDNVIQLKQKYLEGKPGGLDIQVCNLSLGNTTFFAGRDVFDRAIDELLENDIVPVIAAGDTGPSGLTVASPATSFSSIAVGSASFATNDRVEEDLLNFPGYGLRHRPSDAPQVAWFSSRGPNANGSASPDVIAVGVGNFGQGYGGVNDVTVSDKTSFSAALVSGLAAVLRQAFPRARAAQVRNAIIGSGNPSIMGPTFTWLDQGNGFPDAQFAFDHFGTFPRNLPSATPAFSSVAANIERGTGLPVVSGSLAKSTGSLAPGQRSEIFYNVAPNTTRVVITVSNFTSKPNPSPQNIFPEEIYFQVHSAKTSQIGALGDYFDVGDPPGCLSQCDPFITGGTFTINNPEPGVMRITLSGSWTNEAAVSANVAVTSFVESHPDFTTQGIINNHESTDFAVTIPKGAAVAEFRLSFLHDWGTYPTSDVDMTLFDPKFRPDTQGAHLNDPERAVIFKPTPGTWLVHITGFNIESGSDTYVLRVTVDGEVLK